MSLLSSVISVLFSDFRTTIVTLIFGYIVYYLAKFYYKVYSLPPSLFPLPLVGNFPNVFLTRKHFIHQAIDNAKRLGPVYTTWMGSEPVVIISDIDMARDLFRKNDFAGRPKQLMLGTEMVCNEKYSDVICGDYGHRWEALRRVAHSAVQKYSNTDKLVYLCSDCVDHTIDTIIEKEGFDKPFVPFDYIYNMFLNILAASAFGKRYDFDHPEYKLISLWQKDFWQGQSWKMPVWIFFPSTRRFIDPKGYEKYMEIFESYLKLLKDKYQAHYKDYDESVIRDFCDTLITAKNEALREGKESAPYLTDDNLSMALFDLFFAGTDTSQTIFRWLVLYLTYDKEIQRKLREEIASEIGDRIPIHEDRNRCNYVMAFISETLRLHNIVPQGVQHRAVVTSKIGDYTIPENTQVMVFQGYIMQDEKHWHNPQDFIPERFLDSDGKYVTTRHKAFIPFGIGRRVCLGEKLALADLFLVLVRFVQKTSDFDLVCHMDSKEPFSADKHIMTSYHPKEYKISFKRK